MPKTKLTFSVYTGQTKKLKDKLERLFLKKDSFLEHLLSIEIDHLKEDLTGLCNSEKCRRFINQSMDKKRRTDQVTISLDTALANKIREVTNRHKISRDAFFNRVLVFVLLDKRHLKKLDVIQLLRGLESATNLVDGIPISPFSALEWLIEDPLFGIREALKVNNEKMYLFDLDCLQTGLNLMTACYLSEDELPDSEIEKLAQAVSIDDF